MNKVRKRRLLIVIFVLFISSLVVGLVMYALRQNINLFYSPTQMVNEHTVNKKTIRLGGMVVKNSIKHDPTSLAVEFKLTDFKNTVTVNYKGILPDLFREGQGIVALGQIVDAHHFIAAEVLAKHDANYMPPEVKKSLALSSNFQQTL